MIGSIAETQEMLDFCGKHGIAAEIETIPIDRINEAFERVIRIFIRIRGYRLGIEARGDA